MAAPIKLKGTVVSAGHRIIANALLENEKVHVESKGREFYNASDFSLLYWMSSFFEYVKKNNVPAFSSHIFEDVKSGMKPYPRQNMIRIAATPPWVEKKHMMELDGGLLHEIYHSLFTTRGNRKLSSKKLKVIFDKHYRADLDYAPHANLFRKIWNIFEDSMIERAGMPLHGGAPSRIQAVHNLVWDMEKYARRYPEMGAPMVDAHGDPIKDDNGKPLVLIKGSPIPQTSFREIDHLTCYLRDRIESYLTGAPLAEYNAEVVSFAEMVWPEEIEEGQFTTDSYETLELTFRFMNKLLDLPQPPDGAGGEGDEEEEGGSEDGSGNASGSSCQNPGQGQSKGQKSNPGSSGGSPGNSGDGGQEEQNDQSESGRQGDENEGPSGEDESDEEGQDGDGSEGEGSGKSDEDSDEEGEGKGKGGDQDSGEGQDGDQDSDSESGGQGQDGDQDSDDGQDAQEGQGQNPYSGNLDPQEYRKIKAAIEKALEEGEGLEIKVKEISQVLQQKWDETVNKELAQVLPYSREYDRYIRVTPNANDMNDYLPIEEQARKDTMYIRPKMMAFFRGQTKSQTFHRQEKGSRLSGLSISEVVYKKKPRPFQTKVTTKRKNSCVFIGVDESGSMMGRPTKETRQALAALSMTLGGLRIPLETVGFTTNGPVPSVSYGELQDAPYTRTEGVDFRIYRTFDEPFNQYSYQKIVQTEGRAMTPLPDILEYGAQRLHERTEDQKVMFILTDGCPYYGDGQYTQEELLELMQKQVVFYKKFGIDTMFIGIGRSAEYIQKYPNSLYCENIGMFAAQVSQFIFQQMFQQ